MSAEVTNRNHTLDTAIDLTGGTLGGIANCLVGQPFDTVKVKMQTFPSLYKNAFKCFFQTLRNEGILHGLYAGTVPALVANVAENAVLFTCYGICQKSMMSLTGANSEHELKTVYKALAGSEAAFFAAVALTPTELVKCKLQAMKEMKNAGKLKPEETFKGPAHIVKHILKNEGIRGMFRGFVPTVAREMPGYFFFFGGYEFSRRMLTPEGKTPDDIGVTKTILCGGFGGALFWISIFPTDVIKSRAQISTGKSAGFMQIFRTILKEDGVLALYKGLGPTVLRTFISSGALFFTYEYTKMFLNSMAYGK